MRYEIICSCFLDLDMSSEILDFSQSGKGASKTKGVSQQKRENEIFS